MCRRLHRRHSNLAINCLFSPPLTTNEKNIERKREKNEAFKNYIRDDFFLRRNVELVRRWTYVGFRGERDCNLVIFFTEVKKKHGWKQSFMIFIFLEQKKKKQALCYTFLCEMQTVIFVISKVSISRAYREVYLCGKETRTMK